METSEAIESSEVKEAIIEIDPEDKVCYEVPLSPQDLVAIYQVKDEDDEFVLWVDYKKSKEKLTAKHIMIYLANTNFTTSFSSVDADLIKAYISSEFMVDCSLLSRIVVNIIKIKLGYTLSDAESALQLLFSEDDINKFIEENSELVDEVIETLRSAVPFILHKLWDGLPDDAKAVEENLSDLVSQIKPYDKPSVCGPNIARLITSGYDAFLLVINLRGLGLEFNKSVYNDKPKYFGKDLYFILNHTNVVSQVLSFFPEDFLNADYQE